MILQRITAVSIKTIVCTGLFALSVVEWDDLGDARESRKKLGNLPGQIDQHVVVAAGISTPADVDRSVRCLTGQIVGNEPIGPERPQEVVDLGLIGLRADVNVDHVSLSTSIFNQPAGEEERRFRRIELVEVDAGHRRMRGWPSADSAARSRRYCTSNGTGRPVEARAVPER